MYAQMIKNILFYKLSEHDLFLKLFMIRWQHI